jgi:hypothetical protein
MQYERRRRNRRGNRNAAPNNSRSSPQLFPPVRILFDALDEAICCPFIGTTDSFSSIEVTDIRYYLPSETFDHRRSYRRERA